MATAMLLITAIVALLSCPSLAIKITNAQMRALDTKYKNEGRSLTQTLEPQEPAGWWQSVRTVGLSANSPNCGLRDFPPLGGDGEARMLCGGYTQEFDPAWVWKATKSTWTVNAGDEYVDPIMTGDFFNLRMFNQMRTFCRLQGSKGQVYCGVNFNTAALFQFENAEQPGVLGLLLDFSFNTLYLKGNGRYCRINGKGNSAYVYCDLLTVSGATMFQMPYSHFSTFNINSTSTGEGCGAMAIVMDASVPTINCTSSTSWPANYYTDMVISAQVPGARYIYYGSNYSFSFYNELWHYHYYFWALDGDTDSVTSQMWGPIDGMWFQMEGVGKAIFDPVIDLDTVMLKSGKTGKYCGTASATAPMLCNKISLNPLIDKGYYFLITYDINLNKAEVAIAFGQEN